MEVVGAECGDLAMSGLKLRKKAISDDCMELKTWTVQGAAHVEWEKQQRGGDGIGRHKGGWKEKEVDSNLKEEVELNLMEVLLSCSFSFLRGKYEIWN